MVLVSDDPSPVLLPQPERKAQAVLRVVVQFLLRSAAQECVGIGDLIARRDVEGDDLERSAPDLPHE